MMCWSKCAQHSQLEHFPSLRRCLLQNSSNKDEKSSTVRQPSFFLAFGRAIGYVHLNTISAAPGIKRTRQNIIAADAVFGTAVRQFFENLNQYAPMNDLHRWAVALCAEQNLLANIPTAHNQGGEFCAVAHCPE
jgi:hypothetical protein